MNLQELKQKNPAELISEAEKLGIENPSTLRKQEILFAILKKLAEKNEQITATEFRSFTRWVWFFESHRVKLFTWSR